MPTPVLKLRKDIWAYFPVNVDALGKGANGAERHCVEWHNVKVRQMAKDQGKTEAAMKADLLPQLLHALSKSRAWSVEAPEPGSKCVAVLAMRFATRRNRNNSNNRSKTRSIKSANTRNAVNAVNARNSKTKKAKNHSSLSGEALLKKARGILNLMSAATVDRLSQEFASLTPKTISESEELLKVVSEIALDQQAYHPLIIHLLHVLDAKHAERPYHEKPSVVVGDRMVSRAMEEPIFAKMEVSAEEENITNRNLDDKVALQKRFFRSVMLFTGFLYRDGFLSWASYSPLLRHFASMALELDPSDLDYRIYDGFAQGLMYTLIRAGARMTEGEAATFQTMLDGIRRLSKEAKRGYVRADALEFLESAENGFKIKPGMTWTVGAPLSDIKRLSKVKKEGLGADVSELWRRFPLDVKQEGPVYVVRFHNKKLRERFEKGGYKSVGDLEAALGKHILALIDDSAHWKRGPSVPGAFVTVVKK